MGECSICLDNNGHCEYMLPCKHKFHSQCIRKWLENNNTCPVCRSPILNQFIGYHKSKTWSTPSIIILCDTSIYIKIYKQQPVTFNYFDLNFVKKTKKKQITMNLNFKSFRKDYKFTLESDNHANHFIDNILCKKNNYEYYTLLQNNYQAYIQDTLQRQYNHNNRSLNSHRVLPPINRNNSITNLRRNNSRTSLRRNSSRNSVSSNNYNNMRNAINNQQYINRSNVRRISLEGRINY